MAGLAFLMWCFQCSTVHPLNSTNLIIPLTEGDGVMHYDIAGSFSSECSDKAIFHDYGHKSKVDTTTFGTKVKSANDWLP